MKRLSLLLLAATITLATPLTVLGEGNRESRISTSLPFLDVTSFAQDSLGYMWIATIDGLNRYNGYEFEQFMNDADDPTSLMSNFIFALLIDSSGDFLIGTARGLCRFDFEKGSFERFSSVATPVYGLYEDSRATVWAATPYGPGIVDKKDMTVDFRYDSHYVNVFWEDDRNRLWMGTAEEKPMAVLRDDGVWESISLPGCHSVNCIYTDPQGKWWLGTNEGILFFDPLTRSAQRLSARTPGVSVLDKFKISFIKEVEPLKLLIGTATDGLYHLDLLSGRLSHNLPARYNPQKSAQLHSCYMDRQGNVWIGTYEKGFVLAGKQSDYFNPDEAQSRDFAGKFITRVYEDSSEALWIATRYDGLYRYTEQEGTRKVTIPGSGKKDPEFLECIFIDSRDRLWIAFESYVIIADITPEGRLAGARRITVDNARIIREDRDGSILIGSWGGLHRFSTGPDGISSKRIFNANVTDICIFGDGDIVFSAYGVGILRYDSADGSLSQMQFGGQEAMIAGNCVTMKLDSRSRLWLGSYGNGLMCIDGDRRTALTRKDGLPSDNILCFQEDMDGNIWASSSHGIVRIKNEGEGFAISSYKNDKKFSSNQYHEKCGCITGDGLIYFGGNHGLTFFNPHDFDSRKAAPVVNLEDLKIFSHSVQPSSEKGAVLQKSISLQKEIVLKHTQSSFTIDYSGIDFFSPSNLTYKYRLLGEEKQWNMAGTYRRASYSNLKRGDYEFQVYAINDDGVESLEPATLRIRVKPAPWFSTAAWTGYVILISLLVYFVMKSVISAKLSNERAGIDRKEKEREKEMTKMKITFFTNISHELRTPLTLIAGPLEKLEATQDMTPEGKLMLDMITRNTKRMMQLINQLMDFAKIENGALTLKAGEIDIVSCLSETYDSFRYLAERKGVRLEFAPRDSRLRMWADTDKVGKILNNLLSNAIKHTPQGGKVVLVSEVIDRVQAAVEFGDDIAHSETFLKVSVDDNGKGVPREKLGELFVRYHHIESDTGARPDYSSNGIGLHYTKSLVEKHKGRISATLKDEGGMIFSFILPIDDVYSDKEKDTSAPDISLYQQVSDYAPAKPGRPGGAKKEEGTLLIVEDNAELRDFLSALLSESYDIRTAPDGKAALKILEKSPADLVLSDVIMPEMTGLELCREIKSKRKLCHIPVVLLTAKSTMDEQIEGLEGGADAYVCKPFNTEYLLLVIKNLLGTVRNVRSCYLTPHAGIPDKEKEDAISAKDRRFMDTLTAYIEKELANQDLDVDMMADELCVSRSVLYRRIKSLTGLSPNDCIRNYRMKRAAELMNSGETLAEVAERSGFSSYSYFSKSFKQHFGVSPKEYLSGRSV